MEKKYSLGEFEEVVLLMVGVLYDEAYGVVIKEEIEQRLKRKVSVGAMQSALRRMEEKGYFIRHTLPWIIMVLSTQSFCSRCT